MLVGSSGGLVEFDSDLEIVTSIKFAMRRAWVTC
jgi:hypothetical protein